MSGVVRFAQFIWPAVAEKLGFSANGHGERVRNGSALCKEGSWMWLELRNGSAVSPPRAPLGAPGLWRSLRKGPLPHQTARALVFDLPPLLSLEAEKEDDSEHSLAALVDWAEETMVTASASSSPATRSS